MFHVGQLVVCVNDTYPTNHLLGEIYPVRGVVYTIRELPYRNNLHGLLLVEIVNEPRLYSDAFAEKAFDIRRFRPVVETRLDVFREMLAPVHGAKQKECV